MKIIEPILCIQFKRRLKMQRSVSKSRTSVNQTAKEKAFVAFCDQPIEFDFRSYSMNIVGLYSYAVESDQQTKIHNALSERVCNRFIQSDGSIDLPTITTFTTSGKEVTVLDVGKNQSLRFLVKNLIDMGKPRTQLTMKISFPRRKKTTKKA